MRNLFLICGAAGCCLAASANPVRNSGFEDGLKGWGATVTSKVPSALTAAGDAAYEGKQALKVKFDSGPAAGVYSTLWQKIPVRPSSRYRLRFLQKAGEGDCPVVFGGGPGWKLRKSTASGPFDWREFSCEFETGPGETSYEIRFIFENRMNSVFIDDVSVERIPAQDEVFTAPVTAYGAVADGTADSTPAFEKAFASGVTVVTVPPGHFRIRNVRIPAGCTLSGTGPESRLSLAAGAEDKALLTLSGSNVVENLRIEAPAKADGVFASHVKNVTVRNVVFGKLRYGVHFDHVDSGVIRSCSMRNVEKAVELVFSDRIRVADNDVEECRKHGIQFWGNYKWDPTRRSESLIVTGNRVRNGGAGAIWGTGYRDIVIANNLVDGAKDVGIDLEWCDDAAITGNVVRNTQNGGISLFFSARRVSIAGNTIINSWKYKTGLRDQWAIRAGIWLTYLNTKDFPGDTGHEDVTITGNTIFNPDLERRAMFIGTGSKRITISGNSVNQGEIFVGGEHNKPLDLEHFENGAVFIDSEGAVRK
ncbi:MAG: right-handed parallel beta-helix repeat-containing protein [Lentisphaeria bacterium]|nr:right-handed parallel beta-helix repeat-containing protein [Lentisphaeria bacterium]